jgi:hypothetical protein
MTKKLSYLGGHSLVRGSPFGPSIKRSREKSLLGSGVKGRRLRREGSIERAEAYLRAIKEGSCDDEGSGSI